MKKKLDAHEYSSAQKFYDDFKLMIRNCFAFNPIGTPVNQAGVELQRLFDEKWKGLPPFHDVSEDEYDEEEEDSDDERARECLTILYSPLFNGADGQHCQVLLPRWRAR
jgi:bromodomain-containing factor 1